VDTNLANRIFAWFAALNSDFFMICMGLFLIAKSDATSVVEGILLVGISISLSSYLLRYVDRRFKREKRFSFTQKEIEIARWDWGTFRVEWSTLKAINVQKWRERWIMGDSSGSDLYYLISFQEEFSPRSKKIEAGRDFTNGKIDCFLFFLAQFARQRNIPIAGVEKDVERDFWDWKIFRNRRMQKKWEEYNNGLRHCF
jgi:hypothetical protein